MQIFIPRENEEETRVSVTPDTVRKFKALGISIAIESKAGQKIFITDEVYRQAGAEIIATECRLHALQIADVILHVLPLEIDAIAQLKPGAWHISFFDPFRYPKHFQQFQQQSTNLISLERIPRTSFAQKMDALSSQSSLAGYVAVIEGAYRLYKTIPMMITPAGTLQAARVFVIGAGVAGLQAIATAKRLGAHVEAFDTRPEVEEQVQSLGARFVKIDLGKTESTRQGYAKALNDEQLKCQQEHLTDICAHADMVITTAKVFGRKAPLIINANMLAAMRPGSVIVDLAVEAGGNTEELIPGRNTRTLNDVHLLGEGYWERKVAVSASQMLATNLLSLIEYLYNEETQQIRCDETDTILKNCWWLKAGQPRF